MGFTDMFKAKFDETVAKGKNYATQQFNQHIAPKMQGMSSAQQTNVDLNDYPEFVQSVLLIPSRKVIIMDIYPK